MKAHFSAYLRRVKDGETVTITDRGTVIARLSPPPPVSSEDAWEQTLDRLEREGHITRAQITMEELRARLRPTNRHVTGVPLGTSQRILDEDREDRF